MGKLKVFCLPYAGGSKSIFQDWIHRYASVAEIVPMEYSGHGSRFCDVLYETADEVADDIFEHIIAMQPQDYMIYGHSMGCLIALLVAIRLEQNRYSRDDSQEDSCRKCSCPFRFVLR